MKEFIPMLGGLWLVLVFQANVLAQTITNQPQSVTNNNASTAIFTVGASNATSYQWRFGGANLSDSGNISGSTTSALTLVDVNSNQAGSYTVVINNTVTSSNALLTILPGTIVRFTFSGIIGEGTNNFVDVQLFDHDKPATVENFIHYIRAGAFTNMFCDRCVPKFVLQGGSFGASNRTDTNPPIYGWDISNRFTKATNQNPPFPPRVDSELNVGPLIQNRFGTIAMATLGDPNTATSAFYFNLVDNSPDLETVDGGFTVFGQILNGTNVLQYFNTLSLGSGWVMGTEFLDNGVLNTNPPFSNLPVDYLGTNPPANANLVFCDFTFLTTPPLNTTPPTVAITSPVATMPLTNSLQGTAYDEVGLAVVICIVTPQAATNGTYPYSYTNGASVTNYAVGTTNWSLSLSPGIYNVSVQSQNGAGYLSPVTNLLVTNTAIAIVGDGTVLFTVATNTANPTNYANPVGYPMQLGSNYEVTAMAGTDSPNQTFVSWTGGGATTTSTNIAFVYDSNVFTATFISNDMGGIAFTSPTTNAVLSNTLFNITGAINTTLLSPPVTVTCQIFTNTPSNYSVTLPQTTTGTTNWLVAVTNYLPTGSYFIQALATDQNGHNTLITTNFSFIADTNPPGVVITFPPAGAVLYESNSIIIQGTATSDNVVPLASVNCTMIPLTEPDGTTPQGSFNNVTAVGTTNWSLDLLDAFEGYIPPGRFNLVVQAVDETGNVAEQTNALTISAILIDGDGTVSLTQGTNVISNLIGYPLQYDVTYGAKATPAAGQAFVNWDYIGYFSTNTSISLSYSGGLLTATFVKSEKGIFFTYPPANSRIATNSFLLRGRIVPSVKSAQVTCHIFSLTTTQEVGSPLTTIGTNTWSVAVTNLPPDGYLVQAVATNADGFSTVISEEFFVLDFKGVAGTYSGLFICSNAGVAPTNSGFFTVTVAATGAFSGRLLFPAYRPFNIGGRFDANGTIGDSYFTLDLPENLAYLYNMTLDLTNGTDQLTASVASGSNSWSSPLVSYRAVTKLSSHTAPATGKYILSLDTTNWVYTNGYASPAINSAGVLTLSGTLPDDASFSQSTRISKDGVWPFYVIPTGYKTNGMLMGWQTNLSSGSSSGQLYWYKAGDVGTYFTSGVDTNINSTGTNYSPPVAGNYSIVFQGGTMTVPLTNTLTVARTGGQFKPAISTDKLTISLSANGVLTGHFLNPGDTKPLQFKGAFFGQSQGGSGFILDGSGQIGYFLLQSQ